MSDKQPHEVSMREQLKGLLDDNVNKYPDAINWVREQLERVNIDDLFTEYEKFAGLLDGTYDDIWSRCPHGPERKVNMIKWYREQTGLGLKESKDSCDDYIAKMRGEYVSPRPVGPIKYVRV